MLVSSWANFIAFASGIAIAASDEDRAIYNHYSITGIQTGVNQRTGARPLRRNILDLQNDEATW
jgi:tyrosinase